MTRESAWLFGGRNLNRQEFPIRGQTPIKPPTKDTEKREMGRKEEEKEGGMGGEGRERARAQGVVGWVLSVEGVPWRRERLITLMSRVLECQRRTGTTGDHARSSTSRVVGIKTRMATGGASEGKRYIRCWRHVQRGLWRNFALKGSGEMRQQLTGLAEWSRGWLA